MRLTKKNFMFLMFFILLTAVICVYGILKELWEGGKAEKIYTGMQTESPFQNVDSSIGISLNEESKYSSEDAVIQYEKWFKDKSKEYPKMIGWIKNFDSPIDYPVMQSTDNSYYLTHLPDDSRNNRGAIFLDEAANSDFTSQVSVLYGHMVKDGTMFGSLNQYRNQEYYNNHKKLELYTANGYKNIELISAYLVKGDSNPYPRGFETSVDFNNYIDKIKNKSFFVSDVTAVPGDKIIILSTCAYDFDNARLAVVGRLVSISDYNNKKGE